MVRLRFICSKFVILLCVGVVVIAVAVVFVDFVIVVAVVVIVVVVAVVVPGAVISRLSLHPVSTNQFHISYHIALAALQFFLNIAPPRYRYPSTFASGVASPMYTTVHTSLLYSAVYVYNFEAE